MNSKKLFSPIFFGLCALCFLSLDISAQDAKPHVQRRASIRGESYAYQLTDQDFVNTPSWNPEQGDAPLPVSQAVKTARENLPRFVKNAESWKVRQVVLQSMGDEKWFYRVHFFCAGAACRETEDRSFAAVVKMDGSIVEPKKVTVEN